MSTQASAYQNHHLTFEVTPEILQELGNKMIQENKEFEDNLVKIPVEQWDRKTIHSMLDAGLDFTNQFGTCYMPTYISSDKVLKEKSTEVQNQLSAYNVESSMRMDMFQAVKAFEERVNNSENKLGLTEQEQRWLKKEVIAYRRNGLDLPEEKRNRIAEIQKESSKLTTEFSNNLNDDVTKHAFTKEELDGMPEDFIGRLDKTEDGQKYFVTLKYPDIVPLLQKCNVEATRKQMDLLNGNKGGARNVEIFEKVLALRNEQADILGYPFYSDYALELKMAKKTDTVLKFLSDLRAKLVPYGEKELQVLVNLKNEHLKKIGKESDGKINSWDFGFYNNLLLDSEYKLDHDKIKEYFPIEIVTQGMFEIYQKILGLRFEKLTDFKTWHEDVTSYAVYDQKSNNFMGQFYLDMYPREGKYGHACVIGTQKTGIRADGTRQLPMCIMLCNFTKPSQGKPSLLRHGEVETFFHEFGHVMHNICSEAEVYSFSCTQVERDFVEAPSQMLENWTYEEEPLNIMSGHYEDNSKKLPKEYLNSIVKAKNVNTGLLNLRQLFFGILDMTVHTSKQKVDSEKLWASLRKDVTLIEQQAGTNPSGGFAHIMGGYQAGYYGYLWSQVYSADMFLGGFKGDPMNPELGMKYRKCILAPGGSKDGIELLTDFLGRQPQQEAFLKGIGVLDNAKL